MKRLGLLALAIVLLASACTDDTTDDARSDATTPGTDAPVDCTAGALVPAGTERLTVESGGVTREVERVVPPGYDGARPHPLILSLHGFTSNIEQQDLFSGLPEAAAARGYVLLTPQAAEATLPIGGQQISAPYWNIRPEGSAAIPGAQDDIVFLTRLIDSTLDELCIDPARVYVTGNSNGAGMAATLACALPGRLAAIAPVSGINLAATCPDLQPVSVVAFHGDADPLVPYEGGSAANVELGNPPVESAVGEFARAAECQERPESEFLFSDITLWRWKDCRPGVAVELYTVLGGGHTWPGMLNYVDAERLSRLAQSQELVAVADLDVGAIAGHMTVNIEATEVMLDFFDQHRLESG